MARLIANLLNSPDKWTQGCLGRNKDGKAIPSFDLLRTTNSLTGESLEIDYGAPARSFSLYGAVVRCYDVDRRDQVLDKLRHAIRAVTGRQEYLASFNDRPETTFKDILSVVRLANV